MTQAAFDQRPRSQHPRLHTTGGAYAEKRGDGIALHDAEGRLVARFRDDCIELVAARQLRLTAAESITIDAPDVITRAERAEFRCGESLAVNAPRADWAIGRWELRARRVIERARDMLTNVESLLETRATSLRQLVDEDAELRAGRTTMQSREETRIDGQRVLLG